MREQDHWTEHAALMDALAAEGFIVLGGPLRTEAEVLLVIATESEAAVRARMAVDPWIITGIREIASVDPWTILLDGRLG
jgi:uncharacterized protein YciI